MKKEDFELDLASYKHKILKIRTHTKGMDILFAEDYQPLYDSLLNVFSSLFKSVDAAMDGKEALQMYKKKIALKESYAIIFSDIEMPELNGLELVTEIKKIKKMTI